MMVGVKKFRLEVMRQELDSASFDLKSRVVKHWICESCFDTNWTSTGGWIKDPFSGLPTLISWLTCTLVKRTNSNDNLQQVNNTHYLLQVWIIDVVSSPIPLGFKGLLKSLLRTWFYRMLQLRAHLMCKSSLLLWHNLYLYNLDSNLSFSFLYNCSLRGVQSFM